MGHASRREWGRAEDRWPSFWEEVRTGQCGWALPGELTQASAVPGPRLASACSPRGPPCSPPACTLPPLSCAWEAHSAPSHAPLNWNKRRHAVPVIRPSCCRSGFIGETFLFHEGISSWACLCFPAIRPAPAVVDFFPSVGGTNAPGNVADPRLPAHVWGGYKICSRRRNC